MDRRGQFLEGQRPRRCHPAHHRADEERRGSEREQMTLPLQRFAATTGHRLKISFEPVAKGKKRAGQ
jgi:hypothetical protein